MTHIQIAPSMMCADLWRLDLAVKALEEGGVDLLHFDLMDAHFVSNMPLGLGLIEQLRGHTSLPFDVHLMVEDSDFFVEKLAAIPGVGRLFGGPQSDSGASVGVQQISVHAESARHLDRTLSLIRSHGTGTSREQRGIKAGVALNPATPLAWLDYVTEQLDFVLIMTVNPGFAGQKMVPSALRKISDCRAYLDQRSLDIPIQVDGNVSIANIPAMVAAGADILVAGTSSVFQAGRPIADNIAQTRRAIAAGLEQRHG